MATVSTFHKAMSFYYRINGGHDLVIGRWALISGPNMLGVYDSPAIAFKSVEKLGFPALSVFQIQQEDIDIVKKGPKADGEA